VADFNAAKRSAFHLSPSCCFWWVVQNNIPGLRLAVHRFPFPFLARHKGSAIGFGTLAMTTSLSEEEEIAEPPSLELGKSFRAVDFNICFVSADRFALWPRRRFSPNMEFLGPSQMGRTASRLR